MSTNLPALRSESEGAIATMVDQLALIDRAIKAVMVPNVDYGIVPGAKTPTLLKPGAEKLLGLFHFSAVIPESRIDAYEDWDKAIFAYTVVCQIVREDGTVVCEGIGEANSKEPKWTRNGPQQYGMVNTILKMAKKRALLDATLTATASSGRFTQDLDDLAADGQVVPKNAQNRDYEGPPNVGRRNSSEKKADDAAHANKVRMAALHKYGELFLRAKALEIEELVVIDESMNPSLEEITAEARKLQSAIGMRELELEAANA